MSRPDVIQVSGVQPPLRSALERIAEREGVGLAALGREGFERVARDRGEWPPAATVGASIEHLRDLAREGVELPDEDLARLEADDARLSREAIEALDAVGPGPHRVHIEYRRGSPVPNRRVYLLAGDERLLLPTRVEQGSFTTDVQPEGDGAIRVSRSNFVEWSTVGGSLAYSATVWPGATRDFPNATPDEGGPK